jgi:hypothetical protein
MSETRLFDTKLTSQDVKEWTFQLMNRENFLPDCYRDYRSLIKIIGEKFSFEPRAVAVVQPDGHLGGMYFMGDIFPGHEGMLYMWVWGGWTPSMARQADTYVRFMADNYSLARVTAKTPCDKLGRILSKELSFTEEGRFKKGFMGDGKFKTLRQYRRLF